MKFTWYTYAAATERAEAEFSRAFRAQIRTQELYNPSSEINRSHDFLVLLKVRRERENPPVPPRVLRDWFQARIEKRWPLYDNR